jgi:hypothetical protein
MSLSSFVVRTILPSVAESGAAVYDERPQGFGGAYPQLQSAKDGIDRYLIAGTCIGLDVVTGEVYAPNGLTDTEAGLLRINPNNPKPELFEQKAKRYQARWPWLTILEPDIL